MGNNLVAVYHLLEAGADPTLPNLKGTTVLMLFAKRGQIKMAEMCLAKVPEEERAAAVNAGTASGWTALMTAAENGQVGLVIQSQSDAMNITLKMCKNQSIRN